jgi:spore germination protein
MGCWDSRDIEQLNIHVGTALDKASPTASSKNQHLIKLTTQSISAKPSISQNEQNSQVQGQQYQNITGSGNSIIEIIDRFSQENEKSSYGQHLKVIIIGEKLAKEMNMEMILEQHSRTYEIRDSCILLIAKGLAADTLKIPEGIPAFTLIGIDKNQYKTSRLLPPLSIGKAINIMSARKDFIIQGVQVKHGKIVFNHAAIIKGDTNKLIGHLDEREIEGLNWLTGKVKGGIVKGRDPKTNGLILYEVSTVKSKISPHLKGNHISFDVDIESSGRLNEDVVSAGNAFSNKFIERAQIAATQEIKNQINRTLHKLQKQYQTDVVGFGEQLRIYYPKEWVQIEKNWNKRFSDVPIRYHVNITIKDYMEKGKKEVSK